MTNSKKELLQITYFIIFRIIHWIFLAYILIFMIYESMTVKTADLFYAAALSVLVPAVLVNIKKIPLPEEIKELPYLAKKYHYNPKKALFYAISFETDAVLLLLLQVRNFLFPYESIWIHYSPVLLLFVHVLAKNVGAKFLKKYLHSRIMTNNY